MSNALDSQTLFDSTPTPLMVVDRELRYVAANDAYLQATALRREEVLGRKLLEVLSPDTHQPESEGLRQMRESLERVRSQRMPDLVALLTHPTPRRTPEGRVFEPRQWSYTHKPLLDARGDVAFILQQAVDVTDLHLPDSLKAPPGTGSTEAQLVELLSRASAVQESNEQLEADRRHLQRLFELVPGFVCVLRGPQLVYELVNELFLSVIGHRDLIGMPLRKARPELEGQGVFERLERLYREGESFIARGGRYKVRRKPDLPMEEVIVDFSYTPVRTSDGKTTGILLYGQDVTEKTHAEEQLRHYREHLEELVRERTRALEESEAERRKTEEQLRQSQKMEAVGKLTGGVAHDFNNLLQVIAGNLQLLQRDVVGNERALRHAQMASSAVDRGAKLASQLLAFARRQPLQPAVLNLGRLVRNMDELLRRTLGESVELETVTSGGLWNAAVDPHQLENVVLNLAINARDAMSNNGKLTIEVSNAMLDDHYVRIHPEVIAGQYVLLAVSDTGSGMTPEVLERAFEPFFTTKPEGRGTGLGLSMVYGFVKQSGGHIKIYSEVGHGTTFKLYLPRAMQAETATAEVVQGPVEGGTETILLVEDDPEVRATVVEMVAELGYRVLKAVDGQSALTVLQSGVPVDLMFTDVVMPGPVRSPDLARQAKQLLPDLEVLFTSGYTENAIVHGGRLDPGVQLLSKPYSREDLARKLRQLLNGRKLRISARVQRGMPEPVTAPSPAPTPSLPPPKREEPRRLKVLLVEDDDDVRLSACELLDLLGHDVLAVNSAEEARGALGTHGFDVLFTDVTLPGMSGVELAREASRQRPGMRIVLASGHGAAALPEGSERLKNLVILPKPYALEQIQKALE